MPVLIAAVVIVGMISLVNLVFCVGLVRRLREHTEILNRMSSPTTGAMVAVGDTVGWFEAKTVGGPVVSRQSIGPDTLLAVVSSSCPACAKRLPEFVEVAQRHAGPVLGVVVAADRFDDDAAAMIATLGGFGQVIHEMPSGSVATALGVQAFPAFGLLDAGGVVRASGFAPANLTADVTA